MRRGGRGGGGEGGGGKGRGGVEEGGGGGDSHLIFGPGSLTKEAHRADARSLAQVHTAARALALTAVRFLA